MKTYLVCTQQEWGAATYRSLFVEHDERWKLFRPDDILRPEHLASACITHRPRYVFFLNWSDVVRQEITDRFECVNFHCTRLPFGRGGNPIENLLLCGHAETVMTAHRMTREIDAGPIYGMRGRISLAGAKSDILARFVEPVADLMRWIIKAEPTPTAQVGEVIRFNRLSPDEYQRFWKDRAC